MKRQRGLVIGLILVANALCAMVPRVATKAPIVVRSSMGPLRSSFTSFKPGQSSSLSRTFMTKSYKPTNISLVGNKTFSGSFAQRGMSTQYLQRSVTPSWQSGNQSFNSKYLIPLAAVFGLVLTPKGSVLGEEYTAQEAVKLIGFNDINDLADSKNILAFLNNDNYKNNAALFSIIVADNLHKILPGLEVAIVSLQDHKNENNLEKIRFLNKVVLDVNNLDKISLAKTKLKPIKDALESLLTVEYRKADGTTYRGKVGDISQIKTNSSLARMIKELQADAQLRAHLLHELSKNNAYAWGYSGGLTDIENEFKNAYDSFHQLPETYKDLAEMIVQDQGAYDKVKGYKAYVPHLFKAVEEIEKSYKGS